MKDKAKEALRRAKWGAKATDDTQVELLKVKNNPKEASRILAGDPRKLTKTERQARELKAEEHKRSGGMTHGQKAYFCMGVEEPRLRASATSRVKKTIFVMKS